MGKKTKIGKQRQDKYYHLAKEAGYRSRAAFKLIQLNKRFEFLQKSQALVDLCAAPGGWLQVASQNMPVSSIRIGVDLVPIKSIANCITIIGDIREEKTRHLIKKELQNWEVDCVLHDGAPNVGLFWGHDAYQQNCLTLSALRLTTQILRKNGYFVTKVFRSSDYLSLIDVFKKLFKKVHIWKPAASRLESAEIFVVCERYLKPQRVDPELLDIKVVFSQKATDPKFNPVHLLSNKKKQKKEKPEGYEDGDITQFHEIKASEFISTHDPLLMISQASCITLDENYDSNPFTSNELRECMKDIKVCGPAELRSILQWRKKILANIRKEEKAKIDSEKVEETEEVKELRELEEIDELIRVAQADEKSKIKRKKRQKDKIKIKMNERKEYKMNVDAPLVQDDSELFSLNSISQLLERRKQIEENLERYRQKKILNTQNISEENKISNISKDNNINEVDLEMNNINNESSIDLFNQDLIQTNETSMSEEQRSSLRSSQWFSKINDLLDDEDEENEKLDAVSKHMLRRDKKKLLKNTIEFQDEIKKKSTLNDNFEVQKNDEFNAVNKEDSFSKSDDENSEDDDVVPSKKPKILTPLELALGEQMIYSKKKANNLEEWAWNRYTNNDTNLPSWFVEDEKKHFTKKPPVAQKRVEYYEQKNRSLNARPIKKILEANARKQKRKNRRLEKAKKRAESILKNENMEHIEKVKEMRKIYKRANKPEKKDIKYQVITKGKKGRIPRPNGLYKVVDKRLKKDKRGMDRAKKQKLTRNSKKNKAGKKNKNKKR